MSSKVKKLRAGVIGMGMGRNHVVGFNEHPNAEVVALADINKKTLADAGKQYGIDSLYLDGFEMITKENLDIVGVAVPNKYHMELTIAALDKGCHVFCEKPMAMNVAEAEAMIKAAEKAKRKLMLNYKFRFSKYSWALKQQIDEGMLGDIYFGRSVWHRRRGIPGLNGKKFGDSERTGPWFYNKEIAGGGPLIDLGVHRLDLALWFMGFPEPLWVVGSTYDKLGTKMAKAKGLEYTVEDLAVGMIKFKNGATLEIEASWATNMPERDLMETRIIGTDAGLIQKNINQGYEFEGQIFLEKNGHQFDMCPREFSSELSTSYYHFVDCVAKDKPNMASGKEGLATMRILDALYQSAEENRPIMFD